MNAETQKEVQRHESDGGLQIDFYTAGSHTYADVRISGAKSAKLWGASSPIKSRKDFVDDVSKMFAGIDLRHIDDSNWGILQDDKKFMSALANLRNK